MTVAGLAVLLLVVGWLPSGVAIASGQAAETAGPRRGHDEKIFLQLFALDELVLTGITSAPKGSIAVFEVVVPKGADRPIPAPRPLTFFARVGDRFLDGKIVEIGASTVTVEQCAVRVPCAEATTKGRKGVRKVLKVGKRPPP